MAPNRVSRTTCNQSVMGGSGFVKVQSHSHLGVIEHALRRCAFSPLVRYGTWQKVSMQDGDANDTFFALPKWMAVGTFST